jgi:O-antigen/teichoic acid export membrane protein
MATQQPKVTELRPTTENALAVSKSGLDIVSALSKGTVQLVASRACFMVSGYLIAVTLARGLGPLEYGIYGVIMSALLWIELAGSVGLTGATANLIPQYESDASAIEQTATVLLLTISLLLFLLCWVLAPAFARQFEIPEGSMLFRLAILDLPFNAIYLAYQGLLHGHRRFGTLSVGVIIYSLTKLLGILALLQIGLSVSAALLVNVLATVGVLAYLLIKFPLKGLRPDYGLARSMLRLAFPMGLYLASLQVLLSVDLWSLKSLWSGPGEVIGIYVAALNLSRALAVIPATLSGVLFASLSWALAQHDEGKAQSCILSATRLACIALFPVCALLALHAESIMALLFSRTYASGGDYLTIQVVAFGLLAFFDLYFQALMATGKRKQAAGILLALIPLALLFNLCLIPAFGAIGAALSLVLAMGLGTMIGAIFVYRQLGCLIQLSTVTHVAGATVFIIAISTQVNVTGSWLILKFVLLLGLYSSFLVLVKEITWRELKVFIPWQKETIGTET